MKTIILSLILIIGLNSCDPVCPCVIRSRELVERETKLASESPKHNYYYKVNGVEGFLWEFNSDSLYQVGDTIIK